MIAKTLNKIIRNKTLITIGHQIVKLEFALATSEPIGDKNRSDKITGLNINSRLNKFYFFIFYFGFQPQESLFS